MKPFALSIGGALVPFVGLAFSAHIPHFKIMEDIADYDTHTDLHDQPKYTLFFDEDELGCSEQHQGLTKRGYYTCYNRQTNSVAVSDCQAVIDRIGTTDRLYSVPSGLCLTWFEGTCMSRLCAKSGANRGLNKTSDSMVGELQGVILNDCVTSGMDGMSGDCSNMDANCGTYRLTLEHHGSGVLGGPSSPSR